MYPRRNVIKPCAVTFASVLTGIGALLIIFAPYLYNLATNLVLTLTTKPTFELWRRNPMPLYMEFYFFNWTNFDDISNPNILPRFEEIGPFVFEETREKVNISWNDNDTVTYQHLRYWYFNREKSCCNLSTQITTINPVALTAAYMIKDWSYVLKKGFDVSTKALSTNLWKFVTVGDVLFYGYEDPLINMAKSMPQIEDLKIPPFDKFAWFYTRNGSSSYDGTFNMETSGPSFGSAKQWNYRDYTSNYYGECNKVKGSAGEFFSPNRKRDRISVFSPDVCREITMDYVEDIDIDGTIGYKYILGDSFFDNGTKIPENKCYCEDHCTPYGALNVSTCKYGAPGFISHPHFYGADPFYADKIQGMKPDKEKHQMFMVIEPITGIPLQVAANLQVSILVQPVNGIGFLEKVPTFYFPVTWFQQIVKIPTMLHILLKTLLHLQLILRCIGGIVLVICIAWLIFLLHRPFMLKMGWQSPKDESIIPEMSILKLQDYEKPLIKQNQDTESK